MIAKQSVINSRQVNIDLWSVPAENTRIIDAVSVESFLAYIYDVLFGRAPDASGVAHYRQRLAKGKSRQSIVRDMITSGEFQSRYGKAQREQQDLKDFVVQTYQDTLGRWPDDEGLQTYIRIGSKRNGRKRVERNILNSPEALVLGGGKLARIKALESYANQAWLIDLPLLGRFLQRRNDLLARIERLEMLVGGSTAQMGMPQGNEAFVRAIAAIEAAAPRTILDTIAHVPTDGIEAPAATSGLRPGVKVARTDVLDKDASRQVQQEGWVFRVAVRDARRQQAMKN